MAVVPQPRIPVADWVEPPTGPTHLPGSRTVVRHSITVRELRGTVPISADTEWVREQLATAGYDSTYPRRSAIRNSVLRLLDELGAQAHPDADARRTVVELFAKLAVGEGIVPADPQGRGRVWREFQLGDYPPGVVVRVRPDAYTGEPQAARHNGRLGRLVAARGGSAVVQYDGSTDTTGHRHDPSVLQVYA